MNFLSLKSRMIATQSGDDRVNVIVSKSACLGILYPFQSLRLEHI